MVWSDRQTVEMPCVFCAIVEGKVPCHKVFETTRAMAFLDVNPIRPGHTLVIPKAHAADLTEVGPEDWVAVNELVLWVTERTRKVLGAQGNNLFVASGVAAEQSVRHLHIHVIPRREGDGLDHAEWWLMKVQPCTPEQLAETARSLAPKP